MSDARTLRILTELYGEAQGSAAQARLQNLLDRYRPLLPPPRRTSLTSADAILITYGDQVREPGTPPLLTLAEFCARHLGGLVSGIHVLPFYPYSSDDGFSVIDYRLVDPALGGWPDLARLGRDFRLMFDAVINHLSAQSAWFQAFLRGDPAYQDYFIAVEGNPDLSQVVRPRALPLLTRFATSAGERAVWTTFSDDQVDLNYANPEVLLEICEVLLNYVAHGAEFIRLDAIAYLWKQIGTACIHLPQTHAVIQLWRAMLDEAAPHVRLITETNVPHADNLAYFGDGSNEAQLVYNFALPPLVLHTFHTASAGVLAQWAGGLALPSSRVTFFNFLASHDGIGLNPARGLLAESEIEALVGQAVAHGGLVSYKHNPDGTQTPYELNLNYFDALSDPAGGEPLDLQAARFLAAQAILLALVGVPGIYFHSLFGSRGWPQGVRQTGRNRTINRQKLDRADLERELAGPQSLRRRVYDGFARLLRARAGSPAFDPHGAQQVVPAGEAVFALLRTASGGAPVLCLHNVSARLQPVELDLATQYSAARTGGWLVDLCSGRRLQAQRKRPLRLQPYQVLWLAKEK